MLNNYNEIRVVLCEYIHKTNFTVLFKIKKKNVVLNSYEFRFCG